MTKPRTLDKRHAIRQEFCGRAQPQWVFRFCGEWISCHPSRAAARAAAIAWEHQRHAAMLAEAASWGRKNPEAPTFSC